MPSAAEVREIAAFAELIDACVAAIVRDEDWQRFSHFLEEMLLAGKLPQLPAEPEAARMLACALGRAIWNATPLPGNGFRPRPIPAPGRNDRLPGRPRLQAQALLRRCARFPARIERRDLGLAL